MTLEETTIPGAFLARPDRRDDERGFFARLWEGEVLERAGLDARLAYQAVAWNPAAGTLRGMHYQLAPFAEAKLVACVRGAVHDVLVDLRSDSPAFRRWFGARLDGRSLQMLYVPPGVAHGYLTLEDDSLVHYSISERHSPEHARGIRWDDPEIGISWPGGPRVISERDRSYPLLVAAAGVRVVQSADPER